MPGYPARPCTRPGCRALSLDGTGRCPEHPKEAWAHRGNESRHARGYGSAWDKLRLLILKRDGYRCRCDDCKASGAIKPAHEVDHRKRKEDGGTDDPSNLQAINRDCHKAKTARERGG